MKIEKDAIYASIGCFTGIIIFICGIWYGRAIDVRFPHEPRVGDVYACYRDRRSDSYALTNGFPSESVEITKIVRIHDGAAYAAVWSANISRLEGFGKSDFNMWGPVSNYVNYPKYYTLLKKLDK